MWKAYAIEDQISIKELYSLFDEHYDKEFHFIGESHNFWECMYVIEGNIYATGDERVYKLEKGNIIFHQPMEFHKFHIEQEEGATLLIFSFSMEGLLADYLKEKVFYLTEYQKQIVDSLLAYLHTTLSKSEKISEIREYKYLVHEHATKLYYQRLLTYVYQLILSLVDEGQTSDISMEPDAQIFYNAVKYISDCIDSKVSVNEIASNCFTSTSSLKRIFQKYSGISVHKYVLTYKIKIATELLDSGLSVTETAERLGFSNQAYFSTCYKRETGRLPSEI